MPAFTLTLEQQQELMRAALAEAERGMAEGEAPIGAVIARYNACSPKIVARGHNRVSTLEPPVMCLGAAMEAGVGLVLFGLQAPADSGTQRVRPPESPESKAPAIRGGILAAESRRLFEVWLRGRQGTAQAKFVEQLLALTD